MKDLFFRRMVVLGCIYALFVCVLVYRLFTLQVVEHKRLVAESNHQTTYTADTHLTRGTIYFTTKSGDLVSAATLEHGYTVALIPAKIMDAAAVLAVLEQAGIDVDSELFYKKMKNADGQFEVIAEKVSESSGKKLLKEKVSGLIVTPSSWRAYPAGERAAQVVGFVSYNGDIKEGRLGIERQYNDVLMRTEAALSKNFFADLFTDAKKVTTEGARIEGDVITTIEPTVQAELERILLQTQKEWASKDTFGIVMEASTGKIVALGVSPSFNLNTFNEVSDSSRYQNPFVESVHEMGSIVKILTYAAGIDSGVIDENSTYNDTGTMTLDKKTFSNFDGKARHTVSIREVLRQSLNIGAAHIANKMGFTTMRTYFLDKFKLGEETGIDLPGEVHGIVKNLERDKRIEFATASFGQGIATTPLATLRALTAVSNGGVMVVPHVVSGIQYAGGFTKSISYDDQMTQVLDKETSLIVSRVLASIVDEKLQEGKLKLEHYSVAAKTGTAQIPSPAGGYYSDRYLHTFFGYVPAYEPKYVVMLANREPIGAKYSSETLSEPFMDVVKFLINYYTIKPDR